MPQSRNDDHDEVTTTLPRIEIPVFLPPTTEELERRRIIVERILHRRERIGPIGIRADDLHHEAETETEW